MPETLLSVNNLSVGYSSTDKENVLFENLDISLNAGELVCFMGPNGSGKSTLIRTLAGLQKSLPTEARTKLIASSSTADNLQQNKHTKKALTTVDAKMISVVLTDRIGALNMTVRELITYGRYPYLNWSTKPTAEDQKVIDEVIDKVHLSTLKNKSIDELSDGQLQMVMIAKALAQETPIILLDEPTAHLDLDNRVEIMSTLRKLAHELGKAILVSTHELDLALQTADLLWLADGKSIRTGIPEDLVLDGSLDKIFKFKGFDLKTGKVFHEAHRGISIKLIGEGYRFLWTKNALERSGYEVDDSASIQIEIAESTFKIQNSITTNTVEELLTELKKL